MIAISTVPPKKAMLGERFICRARPNRAEPRGFTKRYQSIKFFKATFERDPQRKSLLQRRFFNAVSWRGSTQMEQLIASSHWTDSSALTKARETWRFSNWSHSRQAMVASKGNDCRIFKFLPWASLLSLVA